MLVAGPVGLSGQMVKGGPFPGFLAGATAPNQPSVQQENNEGEIREMYFIETRRGLRGIAGIHVVALIPGQHDPGDCRNAGIIQLAHDLSTDGCEIGYGDGEACMQILQFSNFSGVRENRLQLG